MGWKRARLWPFVFQAQSGEVGLLVEGAGAAGKRLIDPESPSLSHSVCS